MNKNKSLHCMVQQIVLKQDMVQKSRFI